MRVAYLINGLNGGGAALPVADVIGAIRAAGHEARVIALMRQDGRAAARLEAARIEYRVLGPERFGGRCFLRLLRELRRDRPDLIWTSLARSAIAGQIAGRLLNIPVVSWQNNGFLRWWNLAALRRTQSWARRWVADSDAVKTFAIERLGVDAGRVRVWPLFIADPAAPQAQPWAPPQAFRIGSLGRLHPNKRYDVLVRACARMAQLDPDAARGIQIRIAGSGEEAERLKALAASLGTDALRFEGYLEDPRAFLAGLHGYVQCSHHEGLCIAAHEAMQAGLPVVATPVGQLAHSVVEGETGFRVPVDEVEALAEALLRLARDPARAASMGRTARERVLTSFGRPRFEAIGHELMDELRAELG